MNLDKNMAKFSGPNLSRPFTSAAPTSSHIYSSALKDELDSCGLVIADTTSIESLTKSRHNKSPGEHFVRGCATSVTSRVDRNEKHRSELTVLVSPVDDSDKPKSPALPHYYFGSNDYSPTLNTSKQPQCFGTAGNDEKHHYNLIDLGSPPASPVKNKCQESNTSFPGPIKEDFSSLAKDSGPHFDIGSLIEVFLDEFTPNLYGVVRWTGYSDKANSKALIGVELEDEFDEAGEGFYCGKRYFECQEKRALFVRPEKCRPDPRFSSGIQSPAFSVNKVSSCEMEFGSPDCPPIGGAIPPVSHPNDVADFGGKFRGIQGHHNSCYLDATIFSMFTFTSAFDFLLYRPPNRFDIPQYTEVQKLLREEIVNPLRQRFYVRADKVMKFRRLLQSLSSVTGLTTEEKDPEEFLHCLLAQTLKAEPLLKLHTGQEAFHHQLFVEKDEKLQLPTVQQLFEQSFLSSGIKLKQIPPCLILQMPRFGKSFKMYPYVLPSPLLDITDILEKSPRQCIVCGRLAELECAECLGQCGNGLESIAFCSNCLDKVHSHKKRSSHKALPLKIPSEFAALQDHCVVPRVYMELFAVVCIATSHYVTFAKCGPGPDAPWCFFDSMADRRGEQDGYNIPEVLPCSDLPRWLSEDWEKRGLLTNTDKDDGIPHYVRRLFSDAYMCLYQSPDLLTYR